MLKEKNLSFHAVAGFSLGEYTALAATGVLDMKAIFALVQARAVAMETEIEDSVGRMAAIVHLTIDQIESLCDELGKDQIAVANYNSYKQIVVSYRLDRFEDLQMKVKSLGGRLLPLKVNRPFHTSMMRPAADKYSQTVYRQDLHIPNKDLYLNVTGEKYNTKESLTDKLIEQIFMPVQWIKTIENMLSSGIDTFYEVSPKPTLNSFINNISYGRAKVIDAQKELCSL
jgi:[acyl-carrier-protein] S-malonyltransferase